MRFKVDENLPVELAERLREAGHDASTVHEQRLAGAPDSEIREVCAREARAVVTLDNGLSDLRLLPASSPEAFIVLRLARQDRSSVLRAGMRLIRFLEENSPLGRIWIVEDHRVRVRGL